MRVPILGQSLRRTALALTIFVGVGADRVVAQDFSGTGQQATQLFHMPAGLAVFELQHQGSGAFTFRLLDRTGGVVQELASGSGAFSGSKAVRIPAEGDYLFDVGGAGTWSIRLRPAATAVPAVTVAAPNAAPAGLPLPDSIAVIPAAERGRRAGVQAGKGAEPWSWGWFGKGLVAGTLTGPVGMSVMAVVAGHGSTPAAPGPAGGLDGGNDPLYGEGFRRGFRAGVISGRREAALVGGMVGTAAFAFAMLKVLHISISGGETGTRPPGDPNALVVVRF